MPAGIAYRSVQDVINSTLDNLPAKYQETVALSNHVLVKLFFTDFRQGVPDGTGYRMNIRVLDATTHKQVLPYQGTKTKHEDVSAFQVTDWTFGENKIEFEEKLIMMNGGGSRIYEYMKMQRSAKYANTILVKERMLANLPDNPSDSLKYWGLPYWFRTLNTGAADPTGGFNGKYVIWPDGTAATTLRAGLDLNTTRNARLPNFVGTYSGYIDEALFDLLTRAMTRTDFGSIFQLEGEKPAGSSPGDMYVLADHDRADQLEKRVNKGPDDQQGDVRRFTAPTFRGVKIVRTPILSESPITYAPIYGVKRAKTRGIVLGGEWLREGKAINSPEQLQTWVRGIHDTSNLTCDDARSGGFVLHTVR